MSTQMINMHKEGEYVHFRNIYIPFLGKCALEDGLYGKELKLSKGVTPFNNKRESGGAKYRIENVLLTLDTQKAKVSYCLVWEGGLVEDYQRTYKTEFKYSGKDTIGSRLFDVVCVE